MDIARHVVLDIETAKTADEVGGWNYTSQMGVACAVTLDTDTGRYTVYDPADLDQLRADLDGCDRITTWNGWGFDLPVIYGVDRAPWEFPGSQWSLRPGGSDGRTLENRSRDLLREVYEKLPNREKGWKLGDVAKALLGEGKSGSGVDAPGLFRDGRWGRLATYCQHDVYLTSRIEKFIDKHGFVWNGQRVVKMPRRPTLTANLGA